MTMVKLNAYGNTWEIPRGTNLNNLFFKFTLKVTDEERKKKSKENDPFNFARYKCEYKLPHTINDRQILQSRKFRKRNNRTRRNKKSGM